MLQLLLRMLKSRGIYVYRNSMPWGTELGRDIGRTGGLSQNPVIFDVGANIGQTMAEMIDGWPNARLYCFEPTPETFKQLEAASEPHKAVSVHNLALSASTGTAVIRRGDISVLNQIEPMNDTTGTTSDDSIQTITLDDFCQREKVTQIDLLKIDTEGHDLSVLHGAAESLSRGMIGFVLTEVGFGDANRFCLDTDIRSYLTDRGYRLLGIYGQSPSIYHHGWPHNGLYFANMLFVRDGSLKRRHA